MNIQYEIPATHQLRVGNGMQGPKQISAMEQLEMHAQQFQQSQENYTM